MPVHPNSLKNLKPVRPGEIRNPSGKGGSSISIVTMLRKIAAQEKDGRTLAEAMAAVAIQKALKGNFQYFKEIMSRFDGAVPLRIAGADGDELFANRQKSIEKIFSNPEAMDLAVKLANCMDEAKDRAAGKNNEGDNGNGDITRSDE